MARIVRHITVPRDPAEVFDAVADFSTAGQWDPGIRASRALDTPPVGLGARFAVTLAQAPFGPRLVYRTEVHDRPRRVVLHTRNLLVEGTDDVRVAADGDGSAVTWEADFTVRGLPGRVLDPLLARGFARVGDRAVAGLESWLRTGGRARHTAA